MRDPDRIEVDPDGSVDLIWDDDGRFVLTFTPVHGIIRVQVVDGNATSKRIAIREELDAMIEWQNKHL